MRDPSSFQEAGVFVWALQRLDSSFLQKTWEWVMPDPMFNNYRKVCWKAPLHPRSRGFTFGSLWQSAFLADFPKSSASSPRNTCRFPGRVNKIVMLPSSLEVHGTAADGVKQGVRRVSRSQRPSHCSARPEEMVKEEEGNFPLKPLPFSG